MPVHQGLGQKENGGAHERAPETMCTHAQSAEGESEALGVKG